MIIMVKGYKHKRGKKYRQGRLIPGFFGINSFTKWNTLTIYILVIYSNLPDAETSKVDGLAFLY